MSYSLRSIRESDLNAVFKGLSDPAVVRYYGVSYDSLEATREQMSWFQSQEDNGTGKWWAVVDEQGQFVGAGGLNDMKEGNVEIGFWLYPEYWGRGLMTQLLPQIVRYAFDTLGAIRVIGEVESHNIGSSRVMKKLGFQHDGEPLEEQFKDGEKVSVDLYSISKEQFSNLTK